MPNPVQSLGYIECHSSSSPRPVKNPGNSIRYNCEKISSWLRRPKTILEIRNLRIRIRNLSYIKPLKDGWTGWLRLKQQLSILPTTIASFGLESCLFWGNPPPLSGYPLFLKQIWKVTPISESHPNCCIQIVRNNLKWRYYVSYYTKSIENIINITLFTFRLNSVFTTDTSFG